MRKTGEPLRTEYRCIASDGRIVWVEDADVPRARRRRHAAERAGLPLPRHHRAQERRGIDGGGEKFRTLVSNVAGIVFRCELDADWTMHFISETIEQISGYPTGASSETRANAFTSIITRTTWTSSRERWTKPSPPTAYTTEYRIVTRDSEIRWVLERGQAVTEPGGHQVLDGAIFDVTERKTVADEVAKLAAIVESSDDAIMGADRQGVFTSWNSGAEQIFGYGG